MFSSLALYLRLSYWFEVIDQELLIRSPARLRLGVRRNREFVRHKICPNNDIGGSESHIRELESSGDIWRYTGLTRAAEGAVMLKCCNEVRAKYNLNAHFWNRSMFWYNGHKCCSWTCNSLCYSYTLMSSLIILTYSIVLSWLPLGPVRCKSQFSRFPVNSRSWNWHISPTKMEIFRQPSNRFGPCSAPYFSY